jgi:hypothetical protein
MSDEASKHALIEKAAFAVLPILFSCVVYLMSSLASISHEVTVLRQQILRACSVQREVFQIQ